jgi:hypothetical protein
MKKFDVVDAIMAYEEGSLDEEGVVELYQHLIDTGIIYSLQGFYQRTAADLLKAGLVHRRVKG